MNKLLVVAGALLGLFGVGGVVYLLTADQETHPGTIVDRRDRSFDFYTRSAGRGTFAKHVIETKSVGIRLDDTGETTKADIDELAEAVSKRGPGLPVEVETTGDDVVERVKFEGKWYGTGATVGGSVVFGLIVLAGAGLIYWAHRRRRNAEAAEAAG